MNDQIYNKGLLYFNISGFKPKNNDCIFNSIISGYNIEKKGKEGLLKIIDNLSEDILLELKLMNSAKSTRITNL